MVVLVTGGAGYIGCHVCIELINEGHQVITFDNYSNSTNHQLKIIEKSKNCKIIKIRGDVTDLKTLKSLTSRLSFDAVIHLAGLKSVPDGENNPLLYYKTNVCGTINLLNVLKDHNCKKFIFSSSANVYGNPEYLPIDEKHKLDPSNVYGRTKLQAELIIKDFCNTQGQNFNAISLRYFNPVGASKECNIGENSYNKTNIMPMILLSASKKISFLEIYGDSYNTKDGTAIRDYIHVSDLAKAHVKSLHYHKKIYDVFNIGTGESYTIMDLIYTFEKVNNIEVPFKFSKKREGDLPNSCASVKKAKKDLNWKAIFSLDDMCKDAWKWYKSPKSILND